MNRTECCGNSGAEMVEEAMDVTVTSPQVNPIETSPLPAADTSLDTAGTFITGIITTIALLTRFLIHLSLFVFTIIVISELLNRTWENLQF